MDFGIANSARRLEAQGISGVSRTWYNLDEAGLMQEAVRRGEGEIGRGGTFLCSTGKHTGRSPKDKFVVREPSVEQDVWWDNNAPMDPDAFERLRADMVAHMA